MATFDPQGTASQNRHESRTNATFRDFMRDATSILDLDETNATRTCATVLCLLSQRLQGGEADDLRAQLPMKVQEILSECPVHAGARPTKFSRQELIEMAARDLDVPLDVAEHRIRGVFQLLCERVSHGEIVQVVHCLPKKMWDLWPADVVAAVEAQSNGARDVAGREYESLETEEHYEGGAGQTRSGFWAGLPWLGIGIGIGALMARLFSDRGGPPRRQVIFDKTRSVARRTAETTRRKMVDVRQRAAGAAYEARARRHEGDVPDEIVAERVRAQIGRPVSHPRAIDVSVQDGRVTLSGLILADEVSGLLARVKKVRGVKEIDNRLEVHAEAANIPSLQGEGSRQST